MPAGQIGKTLEPILNCAVLSRASKAAFDHSSGYFNPYLVVTLVITVVDVKMSYFFSHEQNPQLWAGLS